MKSAHKSAVLSKLLSTVVLDLYMASTESHL